MLKTVKKIQKQQAESFSFPRSVQDIIPIKRIWEDGIFLLGNGFNKCYSRSWSFSDINYSVAGEKDQKRMSTFYGSFLNSLDSNSIAKITINKHRLSKADFDESVLIAMKNDGLDIYRKEYNEMILSKSRNASGDIQDRYLTVTSRLRDIEDARTYFSKSESLFKTRFNDLNSRLHPMDAAARMKTLYSFFNPSNPDPYPFDIHTASELGASFKDYICPDGAEFKDDYIKLGGRFARILFFKDLANHIDDTIISDLLSICKTAMVSIDIIAIPTDEAIQDAETRLLGINTNITNWQARQNRNNNFSAIVPYDMELQRAETIEFLDKLTRDDQRMMQALITMIITSDSLEQLDQETKSVISKANGVLCQIAVLRYQQYDGLITALPIGPERIHTMRTFTTDALTAFMPFNVQEIMDKNGVYFGENSISHNLIMLNKENLSNQSAFYLGVPGSGKSLGAKQYLEWIVMSTDTDEVIVFDPEGEYVPLARSFGNIASVVNLAAGGNDHINAMSMVDGYGEKDPLVAKSEFILSLIEQIDKNGVGPKQKSIIDRCIKNVYRKSYERDAAPTLCVLREELLRQPEPEAKDLALSLELYTTGSLDIFGHETNVDLNRRVTVFDAHGLSSQLKPTALLVVTDAMLNKVNSNWKRGIRTHICIDEVHIVFESPYSAHFFASAWRQFRKRNAYPTAITQNVEYLLSSVEGRSMLSNSELIVMFNQAASDREELARLLNISKEQLSYITNAEPGCGLIRYGGSLVPFENRLPKDTKLYQLMTTRPGEGEFSGNTA